MVRHTLQQIGREARQYRKKHGAGVRLPVGLRKAAALLATRDDAEAIAEELKISRETLRRWGIRYPSVRGAVVSPQSATKASRSAARSRAKKFDFIEIEDTTPRRVDQLDGSSSVVEVTRPDGWTVRVTGDLVKDLAAATLAKLSF
jgi:hypothetical protein